MDIKKTVTLRGTLQEDNLIYRPFPYDELNHTSNISIQSISFASRDNIREVCFVSCNLVQSKQYTGNSSIQSKENFLSTFLLSTTAGPTPYQNCIRLPLCWFPVTNVSDHLKISIWKFNGQKFTDKNCDIVLNVALK